MSALAMNLEAPQGASPYARRVDEYVRAGYTPIPLRPREKIPGEWQGSIENGRWSLMDGWNEYAKRAPFPAMIERWKTWPDANVGIVLGTPCGEYIVVALDIDSHDPDVVERIKSCVPFTGMRKVGGKGETLFFRASPSLLSKQYKDADKKMIAEILAKGRQTVMPPSVHPDGPEYRFTGKLLPPGELPILDDYIEALEETLSAVGWVQSAAQVRKAHVANPVGGQPDNDNAEPSIWREVNDAALQDFDSWVGALHLPKANRHANGSWEAVPFWRPSNEGNETQQRKPNLKFHVTGIKDMGDDLGYTASDVVRAAFGWDFDKAHSWLRGRLGLANLGGDDLTGPGNRRLVEAEDGTCSDESTGEIVPLAQEVALASTAMEFPDALTRPPGLLGDIVQHVVDTATSPSRVLALGAALVVLGTIIGRRDATPTMSGTHLYAIGLGRTGCGKQHPQTVGAHLLKIAASDYNDVCLVNAPEFMSQTGITEQVEDKPQSASFVDELGAFLKRVNAPKAAPHDLGIKKVLLSLWGMSFIDYQTPAFARVPSRTIESPAYSFFGLSTPGTFYAALQNDDKDNGLLNRCLLLPTMQLPPLVDPQYDFRDVPESLVEKLKAAYRVRRDPYLIHRVEWEDAAAKAIYDAFNSKCRFRPDPEYFARSAEMAGRIATILAVGRDIDFPTVSVADIEYGIAVAQWSSQRMATDASTNVSDTQWGRESASIMSKLRASPGGRCKQAAISHGLGIPSDLMRKHVSDLRAMDLLTIDIVKPAKGGRDVTMLVATRQ